MPKKIGTNPKAAEARERKAEQKQTIKEKAAKAAEDAQWIDDDKSLAKKKSRKEDEERKRAELLRKKAENKALLEQEAVALKPAPKQSIQKITQAQIRGENEKRQKVIEKLYKPAQEPQSKVVIVNDDPIEENLNRLEPETIDARGIEEAIAALSVASASDKHPEKRMKAAFKAFEAANLPRIKAEYPSMRLSQWKQLLYKEWLKSPENPLNAPQ